MIKLSFIAFFLLIILNQPAAQTLKETSQQIEGLPIGMPNGNGEVLYTGNNTCVYVTGRENITSGRTAALVKVNSEAAVLWNAEKTDGFLGAAKFANNIIEFSTDDWKNNSADFIKTIHAKLIDIATGKTILEKDVYKVTDKLYVEPFIHSDANGNFQYLKVRYTKQDKLVYLSSEKHEAALNATTKIDLVSLSANLESKIITLSATTLNNNTYFSSATDSKGDLFIASYSSSGVTIDKFPYQQTNAVASLTLKSSLGNSEEYGTLNFGENDNEIIALFHTDNEKSSNFLLARFNFNTSRVYFDKVPEVLLPTKKDESLSIVKLETYKDRIVLVSEQTALDVQNYTQLKPQSMYPNKDAEVIYSSNDLHITICDSNFKVVKDYLVEKSAKFSLSVGIHSGCNINEHRLFILSNDMPRHNSVDTKYVIFDLDDLTLKEGIFNAKVKGLDVIEGDEILWLDNTALVPYLIDRSIGFTTKFDNILQKIEF